MSEDDYNSGYNDGLKDGRQEGREEGFKEAVKGFIKLLEGYKTHVEREVRSTFADLMSDTEALI